MKTRPLVLFLIAAALLRPFSAPGRPLPTPVPRAKAADSTGGTPSKPDQAAGTAVPLARWLLEQNGGPNSITISLGQVLQAATGKTVLPLDRKDPQAASFLKLVGGGLDGLLPLMNKPGSSAHSATDADHAALAFGTALAEKLSQTKDLTVQNPPSAAPGLSGEYPLFVVSQGEEQRTYCLGVSPFSTAAVDHEGSRRAIGLRPADLAVLPLRDGSICLLILIETNGKTGKEAAFLNWELLDAATLPVQAVMTFEGTRDAVHVPAAKLDDGRKGQD